MNEAAYFPTLMENPNFISRPPNPGAVNFYKTIGAEALYHSPFKAVSRFSELLMEKIDPLNETRRLTKQEANEKYGMGGLLSFDEDIEEGAAALMMRRKIAENDRAYVIQSGSTSGFRQAAGLGVGMAATLLDPINVGAMFIPIVGEARFARMVSRFGGSVTKARMAQGAIEGAVGSAMVEPFILLPAMQEQANYGLQDSALNLAYGAGLGSALHAGFGAIGDRLKKLKPREQDAIFEAALSNILSDEPVMAPVKLEEFTEKLNQISGIVAAEGPERVTAAAVRFADGEVRRGPNHALIVEQITPDDLRGSEDGFVSSTGRFLTREEAAKLTGQDKPLTVEDVSKSRNLSILTNLQSIDDIEAAARAGNDLVLWHGGTDPHHVPLFTTTDRSGSEWFVSNGGGKLFQVSVRTENPLKISDVNGAKQLSKVLNDGGFKLEIIGDESGWTYKIHSKLEEGISGVPHENLIDLVYDSNVRKILTKAGYDSVVLWDTLANGDIPTLVVIKSTDQIRGAVTLRDAKGRFLKKEERLRMLKEQIDATRIRDEKQGQIEHKDNQKDIPRLSTEDLRNASETSEVLNVVTKEADELDQELSRRAALDDDDAKIEYEALQQQIKAEIGDPKARETGVKAAVDCVIKELI